MKSAADLTVGEYIRQYVLPAEMSVKEAANRLGVGRPALSNLLNGNAALSSDMAVRLEKSFGVDRQTLLDMQAAADRAKQREAERAVTVRRYVSNFLSIKARQIETWTEDHLDARQLLPVLLRRLVHSHGRSNWRSNTRTLPACSKRLLLRMTMRRNRTIPRRTSASG